MPKDFSLNIVQGKTYDTAAGEGRALWARVESVLRVAQPRVVREGLKDDFDNGEPYYPLHGREIWLPPQADLRPRREFLEWHAGTVFRG